MQRVSAFLPSWERRKSSISKHNGLFGWSNRLSISQPPTGLVKINTAAANGLDQQVHREIFWPATLGRECDKAARILKTFCVDGYLSPVEIDEALSPFAGVPKTLANVPKKIPKRILQNAAGIAIFTCMRNGLWMTGSGGSGILIARKSDGTWSPPSGIMLHTPSLSFIIGVDVYDCVLVISDLAALESVTKPRVTLGDDVELRTGQSVPLDSDEAEVNWREMGNSVLTYIKARGQQQSVNLNGCILTERYNENERFYHGDVTQMDILAGNVARQVEETTPLFEVIKMAEGRTDFEQVVIDKVTAEPALEDAIITTPKSAPVSPRPVFGIPKSDDPDPFGVLALEMAGLEIREAGSRIRPTSSLFDLSQNHTSPGFSKLGRQSSDTFVSRSNRGSYMSIRTIRSQVTDVGTQTNVSNTPETTPSPGLSDAGTGRASPVQVLGVKEEDEEEVDYTTVDTTPIRHLSQEYSAAALRAVTMTQPGREGCVSARTAGSGYEGTWPNDHEQGEDEDGTNDADDEVDAEDEDEEEPVVFEVAAAQPARTQALASRMIQAKGNVVTIAKRAAPPLPTRSPARMSRISGFGEDAAGAPSPLQQTFNEAEPGGEEEQGQAPAGAKVADIRPTEPGSVAEAESLQEQTEKADAGSRKKRTFSGAAEERWSVGGFPHVSPPSKGRFSTADDTAGQDAPKPSAKEMEKPAAHEALSPLSEAMQSPIGATN